MVVVVCDGWWVVGGGQAEQGGKYIHTYLVSYRAKTGTITGHSCRKNKPRDGLIRLFRAINPKPWTGFDKEPRRSREDSLARLVGSPVRMNNLLVTRTREKNMRVLSFVDAVAVQYRHSTAAQHSTAQQQQQQRHQPRSNSSSNSLLLRSFVRSFVRSFPFPFCSVCICTLSRFAFASFEFTFLPYLHIITIVVIIPS